MGLLQDLPAHHTQKGKWWEGEVITLAQFESVGNDSVRF